jgi:hypothetical protein
MQQYVPENVNLKIQYEERGMSYEDSNGHFGPVKFVEYLEKLRDYCPYGTVQQFRLKGIHFLLYFRWQRPCTIRSLL